MSKICKFERDTVAAEAFRPAPEKIIAGNPTQKIWNHYVDRSAQFNCGIWQGEAGTWTVEYAPHEEEFCVLLDSKAILTDADGVATELVKGDAFVVPGGFRGTWQNVTQVTKHYAIMQLQDTTEEEEMT